MAFFSFEMMRGGEPPAWSLARISTRIGNRIRTLAITTSPSMGMNGLHVLARATIFSTIFPLLPSVFCAPRVVEVRMVEFIAKLEESEFHSERC